MLILILGDAPRLVFGPATVGTVIERDETGAPLEAFLTGSIVNPDADTVFRIDWTDGAGGLLTLDEEAPIEVSDVSLTAHTSGEVIGVARFEGGTAIFSLLFGGGDLLLRPTQR